MTEKRVPLRKCVGCNEQKPKKELIRVVRSPDGEISLDETGKKAGRGAYICHNKACLAKARKGDRLGRILKCDVPDEVYTRLEEGL